MLRIRCLVFMVVIFYCNKANDAACTNENILQGGLKENYKLWGHLLYEIQVISRFIVLIHASGITNANRSLLSENKLKKVLIRAKYTIPNGANQASFVHDRVRRGVGLFLI